MPHLLLNLNLIEPIHNLNVHLLLLDPLVYLKNIDILINYILIFVICLSYHHLHYTGHPQHLHRILHHLNRNHHQHVQHNLHHNLDHNHHLCRLQLEGKLCLGPGRLNLLVVGGLLQLKVSLSKRKFPVASNNSVLRDHSPCRVQSRCRSAVSPLVSSLRPKRSLSGNPWGCFFLFHFDFQNIFD